MNELRIFLGKKPHQWLPMEVLRSSIESRTSASIKFIELQYVPFTLKSKSGSIAAFYRFAIPELCNYEGRALYLDADSLVLTDINELFEWEMGMHGALARKLNPSRSFGYYTSVMLLDNSRLKHWNLTEWAKKIDSDPSLYKETLWAEEKGLNAGDFGTLPDVWNDSENFSQETKILGFRNVTTQPWKQPDHPFGKLFLRELKNAITTGSVPLDAVESEIRHGLIYPKILDDLRLNDGRLA